MDGIILTLETLKKETQAIFDRPPPKPEAPAKDDAKMDAPAEGETANAGAAPEEGKKDGDAEMKNEEEGKAA